jgi:hypothetical protein
VAHATRVRDVNRASEVSRSAQKRDGNTGIDERGVRERSQTLEVKESHPVRSGTDTWPAAEGVTATGLVESMRKLVKSQERAQVRCPVLRE